MKTAVYALVATIVCSLGAYFYGRSDGEAIANGVWEVREAKTLAKANELLQSANSANRAREQEMASAFVKASDNYQALLKEKADEKDRVLADVRSGARRLRVEITSCPGAGDRAMPEATADPGAGHGETRAELSRATSENLVALASEADEVVAQLTACQASLVSATKGATP